MDELLKRAAEKIGMPPSLAERSAQARATKEGITVEAVLREWAGDEAAPATDTSSDEPGAPSAEAEHTSSATEDAGIASERPTPTAAPTEIDVDYLVALAADAKRMPTKLVRSSADARAKNAGTSIESVLAAWAGVDLDELKAQADAGEPLPVPTSLEPTPSTESAAADAGDAGATDPEPADTVGEAAAAPAAVAAVAMSMDDLLAKVAEVKGMPAALAKRSAEARAKKTGEPLEAVLAEWAGVEASAVGATAPADAQTATATAAPAQQEPDATATAAPTPQPDAMSMDDLLAKVAEVKGMPAALAKRSAEARAKKTGEPVEAVLAEWAGVDVASVATGAPAAPTPEASTPGEASPRDEVPAEGDVEVIEPVRQAREAEEDGGGDEDDVEEPPMRRSAYPAWLAAAFVLIPLLAVVYIVVSPNGPDCGTAGQLRIDDATGLAVNCDGSEYGSNVIDYFSQGGAIFTQCAACHGADGGGGSGPAMANGAVLTTFPDGQCSTHIEWVTLGTAGWPDPSYGATGKPVGGVGVMPSFGAGLTDEQIASVVLYERVQFGGEPLDAALLDCGLADTGDGGDEGSTQAAAE